MIDIKCENTGNRLVINEVSFGLALKLKNAILREIQKYPVGVKLINALRNNQGRTAAEVVADMDVDLSSVIDFLKDCIIGLDTDEQITATIFECLKSCTYKTTYRIDENLFDEVKEAREDYYEIIRACLECNLRPFFKSLQSQLKILLPQVGNNPLMNAVLTESNK